MEQLFKILESWFLCLKHDRSTAVFVYISLKPFTTSITQSILTMAQGWNIAQNSVLVAVEDQALWDGGFERCTASLYGIRLSVCYCGIQVLSPPSLISLSCVWLLNTAALVFNARHDCPLPISHNVCFIFKCQNSNLRYPQTPQQPHHLEVFFLQWNLGCVFGNYSLKPTVRNGKRILQVHAHGSHGRWNAESSPLSAPLLRLW